MKSIALIFSVLFSASVAVATMVGIGTDLEDGGASVAPGTESAQQILAAMTPLKASEIPGMSLLLQTYWQLSIPMADKIFDLSGIQPQYTHWYYRVDENFVKGPGHEMIAAQAQEENRSEDSFNLVEFHKYNGISITLLLPSFYKAKSPTESAAMILNESNNWRRVYSTVSYATTKKWIQDFFEHPENPDIYFNFFYQFRGKFADLITASLAFDQVHNPKLFRDSEKQKINYSEIVGQKFVACWLSNRKSTRKCLSLLTENKNSLLSRIFVDLIRNQKRDLAEFADLSNLKAAYFQSAAERQKFLNGFYVQWIPDTEGFQSYYDDGGKKEAVGEVFTTF